MNKKTTQPIDLIYIAISGYGWGKGKSADAAARNCRSQAPSGKRAKIKVYECHPETELVSDGMQWEYTKGVSVPRLISELTR